jgi:hypothetical protein
MIWLLFLLAFCFAGSGLFMRYERHECIRKEVQP